jgi:hypothetical protein
MSIVALAGGACMRSDDSARRLGSGDSASADTSVTESVAMDSVVEPPLSLRINVPRSVGRGAPVAIEVVLSNLGKTSVPVSIGYEIGARPQADIDAVILSADSTRVWRRHATMPRGGTEPRQARTGTAHETSLSAGDSIIARTTWNGQGAAGKPVAPGVYLVRAVMSVNGKAVATPFGRIEIGP